MASNLRNRSAENRMHTMKGADGGDVREFVLVDW